MLVPPRIIHLRKIRSQVNAPRFLAGECRLDHDPRERQQILQFPPLPIVELPGHPWFVATQFHPEFTSTPRDGHPLFTGFVRAARQHRNAQLPEAASA